MTWALRAPRTPTVFRPLQARFLTIPQAPLCYWLREQFFAKDSLPSV